MYGGVVFFGRVSAPGLEPAGWWAVFIPPLSFGVGFRDAPFHVPLALSGLVGCVKSQELGVFAPRLPRFMLLLSFSDTLLVVSILDIV